MRKKRFYEYTCTCEAYSFPHRFGGGKCKGLHLAEQAWPYSEHCQHCAENTRYGCAVVEGREDLQQCSAYEEFVEVNEIRIYSKVSGLKQRSILPSY